MIAWSAQLLSNKSSNTSRTNRLLQPPEQLAGWAGQLAGTRPRKTSPRTSNTQTLTQPAGNIHVSVSHVCDTTIDGSSETCDRSQGSVQLPRMTGACLERILRTELVIQAGPNYVPNPPSKLPQLDTQPQRKSKNISSSAIFTPMS